MYDITEIFQEIENQLISSMCRNLSRHIDEEQEANANYSQWQAKQLQALERYRKENLKEFSKQFEDINNGLKKYLEMTYNNSKTATEHDIISNLDRNSDAIGVNQEKLNTLIKSVTDDFQKAEYSLLRRSNDLYRQTIYKAQIGLNTGSITLNQAIDMATKDFLSNGINSIRYKNGNLVNIASYSEMALRTAEKRATMYGDGEKRQEWDIDTVVVYGHNGACPLCSRWQNRVYIDDVYSNGKPNNKYPLLSVAIQGGLYHPNCKCPPPQTYIEGITEPPTQKTPQELEKDIQNYNLEQVQRYNERQIRKYKRLEANCLDDTNKKRYSLKVKEWQSKQREFINAHLETLKRDYSREKIRVLNITEPPRNATDITPIIKNNLTSTQNRGNIQGRGNGNNSLNENGKQYYEYLGNIDFKDKKAVSKALLDFENQNQNADIERCIVITPNNKKYLVHGTLDTVDTTMLGDKLKGSINEHNHVTGESQYSFSREDLESCAKDGTFTAFAFDEKYRYVMKFPNHEISEDDVYDAYENAKDEVGEINFMHQYYGAEEYIPDEDIQHEIIKRACEGLGIIYGRTNKT